MQLSDILDLPPPTPWGDADNIPWSDPAFSARMLREHLSQAHDAASRREAAIDEHVRWIDGMLDRRPARILDLGCGPGLYTSRLARLGHECTGIDYSPASIAYAREAAERDGLACTYIEEDIRLAEYGRRFDLAMLISGELNVFSQPSARTILTKIHDALLPGGTLVLEVHPFDAVHARGARGRTWYSAPAGVFSDAPHICLQEHAWDAATNTACIRYVIVDPATGAATVYGQTFQAYTDDGYDELLEEAGFTDIEEFPSLTGEEDESKDFVVLTARRSK